MNLRFQSQPVTIIRLNKQTSLDNPMRYAARQEQGGTRQRGFRRSVWNYNRLALSFLCTLFFEIKFWPTRLERNQRPIQYPISSAGDDRRHPLREDCATRGYKGRKNKHRFALRRLGSLIFVGSMSLEVRPQAFFVHWSVGDVMWLSTNLSF